MQRPNCHPGPDILAGFGKCVVPWVSGASSLDLFECQES